MKRHRDTQTPYLLEASLRLIQPEIKLLPPRNYKFLLWGLILFQGLAMLIALFILYPESWLTLRTIGADDLAIPRAFDSNADLNHASSLDDDLFSIFDFLFPFSASKEDPSRYTRTLVQQDSRLFRIRGLEITQGIQVFNEPEDPHCQPDPHHSDYIFCNNSMPLVAGRHTLLRLYLACQADCPTQEVTVHLRVYKADQLKANYTRYPNSEQLHRGQAPYLEELRLHMENSINFEFFPPPEWMAGPIRFEIEVTDQQEAPATLSLTKSFVLRKPLRVAYLPIQYQGITPSESEQMADYWLLRMFPVSSVEYYRLPVPDLVWEDDLNKGEILRELLHIYWLYIQHRPPSEWPDQIFGWLPPEVYNGGASDPFWCPHCAGTGSSRVAFGGLRPELDIGGPRILVHEIAHNLGAQHAWSPTSHQDAHCFKDEGLNIQVDPEWPYQETPYIQEFGLDLYSQPPIIYPPSHYDLMAYCAYPWISPHTYLKIFNSPLLKPEAGLPESISAFRPQQNHRGTTLSISGVLYPDGTASQPEIVQLSHNSLTPPLEFIQPAGDDYCLIIHGRTQPILARHCFEAGFSDPETELPTESSFYFFSLPNIDTSDIAQVTINKQDYPVVTVIPSQSSPELTLNFPNGGEILDGQQTITWQAYDADSSSLSYDLLYSDDGGQSWLPIAVRLKQTHFTVDTDQLSGTQQALIRVVANDGFHTVSDQSDNIFTIQ